MPAFVMLIRRVKMPDSVTCSHILKMYEGSMRSSSDRSKDVHHAKGRGKYLLDTTTWLATCRDCHNWVHDNPAEAMERGFMLRRSV